MPRDALGREDWGQRLGLAIGQIWNTIGFFLVRDDRASDTFRRAMMEKRQRKTARIKAAVKPPALTGPAGADVPLIDYSGQFAPIVPTIRARLQRKANWVCHNSPIPRSKQAGR
jgi:hypothetical protein